VRARKGIGFVLYFFRHLGTAYRLVELYNALNQQKDLHMEGTANGWQFGLNPKAW
jgi:hypothetical protein